MPKKKTALTIEERLQQALVPAEEQPYEVPENWVWVRLGEVVDILNGDRGKNYPAKSTLSKEGIPFISATNLCDNIVVEDDLLCMSEEQYNKLSAGKLRRNDIVLCIRGSLGKHGKFTFEKGAIASSLVIVRSKDRDVLTDDYVMQYLDVPLFYDEIKKYDNGTAQPNLAAKNLELFLLPLPPLSEQQRIVERIEELFAKLDEAKERLQEVAESFAVRKAAILHKAFTGELTKQWRRENGVSDESWEECTLKELSSVIGDGLHGTPVYSENGDYYFINGNNFDDSFIAIKESTKRVSIEEYKKYAVNLNDNTVLLSINGTLGKTAFYNGEPVILGKSACYINVGEKLDKRFLKEMFHTNAFINYANQKATGSTIKNLGLKAIREYLVPLPFLPEQHEIVRLIDDLLARERKAQQTAEQALASIDLMKKSILARVFRGELGTNKASEASALELLRQVLAEN
ncbi:restriction endonuclease subunit S [Phascolarctobacterium succinatutens]|uniref:restriction endonuclease subunit S n=1 Tax=Phascolarctobacterium succinatutens TaxID=626940 RepID=UPI0026EEA117|nr:restriction endonuclease subunit S [Phascolarctobacterium succinatutens]